MSIADSLMARLGYVKLGKFGLALTPQGRIVTMQPAILDDGSGGRIVGWERNDLAELSLAALPVGRAPAPVIIPEAPIARPMSPPMSFAPTVAAPVKRAQAIAVPGPAPVQVAKLALEGIAQFSTPVAPPAPVAQDDDGDDDWDWQMAMARVRAAADETEVNVRTKIIPAPVARVTPAGPTPVAAAPLVAPTGVRVSPPPLPARPAKMAAPVIRDSSTVRPLPAKPAAPTNVVPLRATTAPMRSSTPIQPLPPRRAARGTEQQDDPATAKIALAPALAPRAPVARPTMPLPPPSEDTVRTRAAAPLQAARRPAPAPPLSVTRLEAIPVEDTRVDTRTDIKPAPLPRFSTRFAAAR